MVEIGGVSYTLTSTRQVFYFGTAVALLLQGACQPTWHGTCYSKKRTKTILKKGALFT